jgi:hypothetical protein
MTQMAVRFKEVDGKRVQVWIPKFNSSETREFRNFSL